MEIKDLVEMIMREHKCSVYTALLIFCNIRDELRRETA